MYLLLVAVILTVLKYIEIDPVAQWSWWVIIGVYAATAVWWQVADATGYSRRKSMEKEDQIKKDRHQRNSDRLKQTNNRRK
jgi:small Trp-rich protein